VQEIAGLSDLTPRYARAVRQREQLAAEIGELERESAELSRQVRFLETAVGLRDKWSRRALLDQQLALAGGAPHIPAGALERLDSLNAGLRKRKRLALKLRERRKTLRSQARELPALGMLAHQAARIQALCDQQEWIAALERKADSLKEEAAGIEAQTAQQRRRLELTADAAASLPRGLSSRALTPLKPLARAMEDARTRLEQIRREDAAERQAAVVLDQRIETALAEEPRADLMASIQEAGERVSQLRRRAQLDQRLTQMQTHERELEDQAGDLLDRQLLPLWVVVALGGVFVLGVVLILAGWWLSFGWTVAVLGVAGIIASVVLKHHLENAAEQQMDNNEKQLALLKRQIQQAKEEREELDEELPQGGGPILTRLEKAEAELTRLEELLPVDVQRRTVVQNTNTAGRRLEEAEAASRESRQRWQQALADAGLPEDLTPGQVWQLSGRSRQLRELDRQLERVREEEAHTRHAVRAFGERVSELLADAELVPTSQKPSDQLRQLRKELAGQDGVRQKRRALAREDRKLQRRGRKLNTSRRRLSAQRRRLFEQIDAMDEDDFRRRVSQFSHLAELRTSREALQQDIALALGTQYTEEALRQRLESILPEKLEAEWEELNDRLTRCEAALKQRFEKRGELSHEIELLAADRRLPERQLELGVVRQQLKEAARQWQTLAVTGSILESVRSQYERERQPQTLQDASQLLRELTGGRYTRVWTPMDEDRLLVDEPEGRSLPLEVLSRGTREQLFLSLRLALVRLYARRGVRLPMVLDDVLVNFDDARTKAAAGLLAQFAEEGHQLLVFTCHEHVARLLRSLQAFVTELPHRELRLDEPEPQPVKRPRRRKAPARIAESEVAEPPPVVPDPPPTLEILEAEPVVEPPILIAQPLVEEPPPLPSDSEEAEFIEYDPPLPLNREPVLAPRILEELRPTPPIKSPPAPPLQPARPRAHWGIFRGHGAEEFLGEFATRGDHYEE
jgi:uncharacterized protein YhaN